MFLSGLMLGLVIGYWLAVATMFLAQLFLTGWCGAQVVINLLKDRPWYEDIWAAVSAVLAFVFVHHITH